MASLIILHVDMDAFFASVEQLDDPALRGRPVVVGGQSGRGVVAAASYEARQFGIHSAMPIFQARQRCRDLVIVPPRRKRYAQLSRKIMAILEAFSPLVEPISIDEAFMDISGCRRLHGDPPEIGRAVKKEIRDQLGLTCSVGIAPAKFMAKIASDMEKPDGLTIIPPGQVEGFIHQLPIHKVPGVGARAREQLGAMGIKTLGNIRSCPKHLLIRKMGKFGHRLIALANGRDDAKVTTVRETKSISTETTLSEDTADRNELRAHLLSQSQSVASEMRRKQLKGRTITLKVKTADFRLHSRSRTLSRPVQSADPVYRIAVELLNDFPLAKPVRLIGVGASGLRPESEPVQAELFSGGRQTHNPKWDKVDRAMDAVHRRYGEKALARGKLPKPE
jgi:DNA polymerase-4